MPRPKLCRRVKFNPDITYFKPQGVRMSELEIVEINHEEIESYRLRYIEGLDQKEAAKKMATSASTYQRILSAAHKKIAEAIIKGKAIKITK
jgi:predicted DNA-binding protein (UPF0251 family)